MQYISPIKLLDLKIPKSGEGLREYDLVRERKRILAEFELQKLTTIKIKGKELDKSMVIKLFEELADKTSLKYHEVIFKDTALLNFLEYNVVEKKAWKLDAALAEDDDFKAFVSPCFAHSYNLIMTEAVKTKDLFTLEYLVGKPMLVAPADFDSCFNGASRHTNDLLNQCEYYNTGEHTFLLKNVEVLYQTELVLIINGLPEYFNQFKNDYATSLCNLSVAFINKTYLRKYWKKVMYSAMGIECSPSTKQMISDKNIELELDLAIYEKEQKKDKNRREGASAGYGWIIAVKVILLIFVLGRSCSDNNTTNYTPTPVMPPGMRQATQAEYPLDNGKLFQGLETFYVTSYARFKSRFEQMNPVQPATGEEPYSKFIKHFVDEQYTDFSFVVKNKGTWDVVVFLVHQGRVMSDKFIRAGEELRINAAWKGDYQVRFYFGKKWARSVPVIFHMDPGNYATTTLLYGAFMTMSPDFSEYIRKDYELEFRYKNKPDRMDAMDEKKAQTYEFNISTEEGETKITQTSGWL
jgi:hypothetical protein